MAETAPPEVIKPVQKRRPPTKKTPSLIAFPGVNRSAMPVWRKELGERVREVQERRTRATDMVATVGTEPLPSELVRKTSPGLELLPTAEAPPVNPLVVAALRRIERAHSQPAGNAAMATAVAYEDSPEAELNLEPDEEPIEGTKTRTERVHNLAVVPMPILTMADLPQEPRKPKRMIGERDDPALNYLDSIATAVTVENRDYRCAPVFLRMFSAIADLAIICLLSSPFLALTELANLQWRNPRVIGFAVGAFMVVSFLYLTVSIAFTGRTVGMKLFSLRVVDARTGLIPTGGQASGRSLVYLLSLAAAGVALMYVFIDSERHTMHDRFTRTAVIRV
jgi:uncharacterized RDD family membrane protein YckC